MARPMQLAGGVMSSVPVVLIDLEVDGVPGRSYLRTYTPLALRSLAALVEDLAGIEEVPHTLRLLGTRGLVGCALAGLDMARWDARARAAGVPLAALLGSSITRVPAYASLRSRDPDSAAQEAADCGLGTVKLKLGGRPLIEDRRVVEAVREVGVRVMGDFNQSLTFDEALELDALGLEWIEEPLAADDFAGHRALAEALETPIQLGENLEGASEAARCVQAGASDLLMFDAMKIGGVTGWMAARPSLPLSSHTFPEFSVHLLAASPTAHWLEHLDHLAPILERPLTVRDGHALVPDEPGAGLHWDERAIARLSRM